MKVLASGKQQITLYYGEQTLNGKPYNHTGIDMVKETNSLDTIVAAEKGKVTKIVSNVKGRDQTTPNMIQGLKGIFARKPLISIGI